MDWDLHLTLDAPRPAAPLRCPCPADLPAGPGRLTGVHGEVACDVHDGWLHTVLPALPPGPLVWHLVDASAGPSPITAVASDGAVNLTLAGAPWATLHLNDAPKPYLHPLFAPGGASVVRGWPVAPHPADRTDHPHQRGLWVAHGEINGADLWDEREGRGGRVAVLATRVRPAQTHADVAADLRWDSAAGAPAVSEHRTFRFWALDGDVWLLDVHSEFGGISGGPLHFGDTKEGGLVAVRLAAGLEANRGGRIRTSTGADGEKEAWGRPADWCDCSGTTLETPEAGEVGVALLSHPSNPTGTMRWHVRAYGLCAANPFALLAYEPAAGRSGAWDAPDGRARFAFRVCLHRGDASVVSAHWHAWAQPPMCRWRPA